jgi:hypothetical protein
VGAAVAPHQRLAGRTAPSGRGHHPPTAPGLSPPAPPGPQKDVIFLKVNKLSSIKTQLPYEYYSLPYCRPEKIIQSAENLGEVLRGDRIENSLYQVGTQRAPPPSLPRGRC